MDERIEKLENLVYALVKRIDNEKYYSTASMDGVRKNVGDITPYIHTQTAYIGDTEATFYEVPNKGNMTIFFPHPYTVERLTDRIIVSFDALEEVTEITISIL